MHPSLIIIIIHTGERSPVDNDEIQIVGTKLSSNKFVPPIFIEIVVPHAGQ